MAGDTCSSITSVERNDGRYVLNKEATTGSYCAHADDILVTCRRNSDAPASDQVLVLVRRGDYKLGQTTTWDTLGMRGTRSPGFSLQSSVTRRRSSPARSPIPPRNRWCLYPHILWASLWWGIAADAVVRAATYVRGEARKKPGTVPPTATRLAEASVQLQAMRHNWVSLQPTLMGSQGPDGLQELLSIGWALKFNNLKMGASTVAPQIVHQALQIVGFSATRTTRRSVGRHYRDTLSASIMISNERIASKSASMLLCLQGSVTWAHRDTTSSNSTKTWFGHGLIVPCRRAGRFRERRGL